MVTYLPSIVFRQLWLSHLALFISIYGYIIARDGGVVAQSSVLGDSAYPALDHTSHITTPLVTVSNTISIAVNPPNNTLSTSVLLSSTFSEESNTNFLYTLLQSKSDSLPEYSRTNSIAPSQTLEAAWAVNSDILPSPSKNVISSSNDYGQPSANSYTEQQKIFSSSSFKMDYSTADLSLYPPRLDVSTTGLNDKAQISLSDSFLPSPVPILSTENAPFDQTPALFHRGANTASLTQQEQVFSSFISEELHSDFPPHTSNVELNLFSSKANDISQYNQVAAIVYQHPDQALSSTAEVEPEKSSAMLLLPNHVSQGPATKEQTISELFLPSSYVPSHLVSLASLEDSTAQPADAETDDTDNKDWAVPLVVTFAILLVVVTMVLLLFYWKFRRLKYRTRTSSQIDEMTLPYPRGGHYPGRRQVPSSLPAALTNQAISVKNKISASLTSNKNGSLLKQKNGNARKQASGFSKPDVDEYNQMSNFEEIELDSLSSADYPDADVYTLQESRFYDYGYGSSNLTSFEKRFQKYVRESSNKSTASLQSSGNSAPIVPHTPLDGAGSSIEHQQTSAPSLQHYKHSTKLPPVKPKRTFDYINSHSHHGFENRGYIHDYDVEPGGGVDHVTEDRWSNSQEEQDSDSVSELNSVVHAGSDRIHDSATESEGTQETVSASSSASEKRPRILKCVSFDESQLKATNARLRVNDQPPRRKISTVSVPSSEHLEVPDSGFKKQRSMYDTVDNLAAVSEDSPPTTQFFIGNPSDTSAINEDVKSSSLTRKKTPITRISEPENVSNEPKTSNLNPALDDSRKSEEKHDTQDGPEVKVKSDFVTPIISVAAKKILEGRNSRKLKQQKSCEGAGDEGVSRYLNSGDISKYTEYIRDRTSSAPASALASPAPTNKTVQILNVQNIPKIILTKEDSSAKEDAKKQQEQIALAPSRTRRIARANNPFLIEVDRSTSASEKVRRASAPSMPLGAKVNDGGTRVDMMTRSASGEFLSAGLGGRSHASPHTARSWSAEFYDLMAKSRANDPLNDKFLKQMIDERYEALFGRKYPEISSLSRSPAMSPRVVKRRAAERKVASLDRDLNPHKLMMMYNKEPENEAQLAGNRWSPRRFYPEDAPQDTYIRGLKNNQKKFSNFNIAQRPALTPGTDGCEDDQDRGGSEAQENGPASHKDNVPENSVAGTKMRPPRNTSLSEVTELTTGDSMTRMDKDDGGHQVTSAKSSVDMRTRNPQSSTRRPVSDSMIFFQDNRLNLKLDHDPPSKYYRSDDPPSKYYRSDDPPSKYYRSDDPPSRFYKPDDPPSERYMPDLTSKLYRSDDPPSKLNKPIIEQTPLENKQRRLERQWNVDSNTATNPNPDETSDTEAPTKPQEAYSVGRENQGQSLSKTPVKPYRRNRRGFSSEDGTNVADEPHQNPTTSKEEELIEQHHDVPEFNEIRSQLPGRKMISEVYDQDGRNSEASDQDDAHASGSSEADSSDSSTDSEDDSDDASSYTINMEDTNEDYNISLGGLYTHQSSNV